MIVVYAAVIETVYVAVIETEYINMGVVASEGNKKGPKAKGVPVQ
jgi:hypothetical protein